MGAFKDLAIDKMNEKKYQVFIQVANGPDDYDWDEVFTSNNFMESIREAMSLKDKGHAVKLYDTFMDEIHDIKDI